MTPEAIKRLRKRLGLTQVELAHELGMRIYVRPRRGAESREVQRWETGQKQPGPMALRGLVRLLEMVRAGEWEVPHA